VTTYLSRLYDKPQLRAWKARVGAVEAQKVSTSAASRGTKLHKAAEKYLMNEPMDLDNSPHTKSLFIKARPHIDTLNNIRLLETPLYSDKLQLAGTPDCIADWCDPPWEANLAIVDFKSKTKIHKKTMYMEYWLQTAIYAHMFEELFGEKPKLSVLIMACPTISNAIVYTMPMEVCQGMLANFMKDPVAFQEKARG
jgi:hypothetical protein